MGPQGEVGPEGPEGPPGLIDSYSVSVEADQGMMGTALSGTYGQTTTPATLTATVEAGKYLLTWSSEVMRTVPGGGATFFMRLRDTTLATTFGFMRAGPGVANGAAGNIPDDEEFFLAGDLFPFAGSALVTLPAGTHTYKIEYALSTSVTPQVALRAQHQRISLMRIE